MKVWEELVRRGNEVRGERVAVREAANALVRARTVVVTGVGKSALAAELGAALLRSVGVSAWALDALAAGHGDLGALTRLDARDLVVATSLSGETAETIRVAGEARKRGVPVLGITARRRSRLGRIATWTLPLAVGADDRVTDVGLPLVSAAETVAWFGELARRVATKLEWGPDQVARTHPEGSLGRRHVKRGGVAGAG